MAKSRKRAGRMRHQLAREASGAARHITKSRAVVGRLLDDVCRLIEQARARTATAVNLEQTMLYWRVGQRVAQEILAGRRAAYGERIIVERLSRHCRDN